MSEAQRDTGEAMIRLANGYWASRILHVTARLGLADALREGSGTAAALAAAMGLHADALGRLLRALASLGILASDTEGRVRLTTMGMLLRSDVPGSLRDHVARLGEPEYWRAWGALEHSIATGEPAFDAVFGKPIFEHLAEHPDAAARFDAGMAGGSARGAAAVVAGLGDLAGVRAVVDVGGGTGSLLAAVLAAHPTMRGVLFDLPHVARAALATFAAAGVAERARIEAGDFFARVPAGADLYLVQRIIHDWDDSNALRLLRNLRTAMAPHSRVVLIEAVLPPGDAPSHAKLLDINILVMAGGRERTQAEYAALLTAADLQLRGVTPAGPVNSLIEASMPGAAL